MAKFCTDCKRNVTPKRKFSLAKFFLLFGILYLPVYIFQGKQCPICNGKSFTSKV